MPNFNGVDFILERAEATREVQAEIIADWSWPDKTLAQWDVSIASVKQARIAEVATHAAEQETRGQRNTAYTSLERRMIQIVALLKISARRHAQHLPLITNLPEDKNGRPALQARARAVAEAWKQIDPGLTSGPGQTLAVFEAALADAQQRDTATMAAKVAWRSAAESLADKAAELDTDSKDWYALATRQFAPGTSHGDLIRSRIPTITAP